MRRDARSLAEDRSYWPITSTTSEEWDPTRWELTDTCDCPQLKYERNTLVCVDCGTVYGVAQLKTYRSGWSKMAWAVCF